MHESIKLLIESFLDDMENILEGTVGVSQDVINESMKDLRQIFPLFLDRIFNNSSEIEELEKRTDDYSHLSSYCEYRDPDLDTKKDISLKKRKI
uniref:Uncharacterized protein n=1 Tax=viral metagenome TaxID=1070528 RepID=A0A6M3XGS0_9ZZZZ